MEPCVGHRDTRADRALQQHLAQIGGVDLVGQTGADVEPELLPSTSAEVAASTSSRRVR
jgi:hypothetical protein